MAFVRIGSAVVVVMLGLGAACGPVVGLESDAGSESGTASATGEATTQGESVDESGSPAGACGVGDTELIGGGPPGPLGFPPPCRPIIDPGTNGYRCCSDDPATLDGELPAFQGLGIDGGAPLFAEANNDLAQFGLCVDVAQLEGQGLLAPGVEGCPIPCNPTWPADAIDSVCGAARVCCQTVELDPADCVMDVATGLYRPVTGEDIGLLSSWTPAEHATHQDPNGARCLALVDGDPSDPAFESCVRALTVANQRGYCMALGAGQACPHEQPSYVDACERLNGG